MPPRRPRLERRTQPAPPEPMSLKPVKTIRGFDGPETPVDETRQEGTSSNRRINDMVRHQGEVRSKPEPRNAPPHLGQMLAELRRRDQVIKETHIGLLNRETNLRLRYRGPVPENDPESLSIKKSYEVYGKLVEERNELFRRMTNNAQDGGPPSTKYKSPE